MVPASERAAHIWPCLAAAVARTRIVGVVGSGTELPVVPH
jgi:hypothetical protein